MSSIAQFLFIGTCVFICVYILVVIKSFKIWKTVVYYNINNSNSFSVFSINVLYFSQFQLYIMYWIWKHSRAHFKITKIYNAWSLIVRSSHLARSWLPLTFAILKRVRFLCSEHCYVNLQKSLRNSDFISQFFWQFSVNAGSSHWFQAESQNHCVQSN